CFQNAVISISKVEFVFPIVVKKIEISLGEDHFVDRNIGAGREGSADKHHGAIADEAGHHLVRKAFPVKMDQRCVDAVAEVLRGVDQGAIQIEDQEFQGFDWEGANYTNHGSSLTGGERSPAA